MPIDDADYLFVLRVLPPPVTPAAVTLMPATHFDAAISPLMLFHADAATRRLCRLMPLL